MSELKPVEWAVFNGNLNTLKFFIEEQHYDAKQKGYEGKTLLHCACAGGHLDIVKYLINEHKLDPLSEDDSEYTPLHAACKNGHIDIVRYLVDERSVDPDYGNPNRRYGPLHSACSGGHLEIVKFLVDERKCDYTKTSDYDMNVLHVASVMGQVDIARYFIEEKQFDPMSKTTNNRTPIYLACQQGHLDLVKYLVNEKSIDPLHELNDGIRSHMTPFHVACENGHLEIAKFLIEEKGCDPMYNYGRFPTPYTYACAGGHLELIRYLTEKSRCDPGSEGFDLAAASAVTEHLRSGPRKQSLSGRQLPPSGESHPAQRKGMQQDANKVPQQIIHPKYTHKQQVDVPQQSVQADDGHMFTPEDGQLVVTGHPQETYGDPRRQSSSSRQLLSSGESPLPQDANRVPKEKLQQPQHSTAVADQRKRDDSPVPQQKRYPEETHSSQSSSDRQSLPSDEPPLPKRKRMKQENEDPPPNVPLSGPPHLLNPDDLAFLMNHLQPIASHWRAFGLQLGLSSGELDTIAATPLLIPGGPAAYLQEVLSKWLDCAPPFPTLTKLCGALRSRAVDQSRIALELEQQYQTQRTAQSWDEDPELQSLVKKAEPTGRQLGAGTYGSVEQVKIEGATYAAKRFRVEMCKSPNVSHEKFFAELQILCSIRHPNIVQYHCVCYLPNSKSPALVMEQLQTNLHQYLLDPSYANLSLHAKVSILHDIAKGLAYLHNHKPAVIHRDLTARNVLLNSERVAKISDFGNSRIIDTDPACSSEFKSTTRVPGTIIYMPPEACSDHAKFNKKLDIFSFGHLALFTATQVLPCDLLSANFCDDNGELHAHTEVERRQRYIDQLEQQLDRDHDLVKLIKQCLHNSPKMRPTADDVVCILEKLVLATHTCYVQ